MAITDSGLVHLVKLAEHVSATSSDFEPTIYAQRDLVLTSCGADVGSHQENDSPTNGPVVDRKSLTVEILQSGTGQTKMIIRPATRQEIMTLFRNICSNGIMPTLFDSTRLAQCDEILAAEIDGQIAGVVALASTGCDGRQGPTLATIYTVRAFRKRGVALSLCEYGIRKFINTGKATIFCDLTTRAAHETIKRLPADLQAHLKMELSYQGDDASFLIESIENNYRMGNDNMEALLNDGPYDGTDLDHNDVNLYTQFVPIGGRKFLIMPPRDKWDAVRHGDLPKGGPFDGVCPIYELVRTTAGMMGMYDPDGSIFTAASRQPIPSARTYPFAGQYFKCYRGDLRDVSISENHFNVTDEKDREWVCIPVSREEGETGGLGEALLHLGAEPWSEPLKIVIVHCDDKADLATKLSDQLD